MNGTELAFNIAGWGITVGLAIYGGVIFWLHTWLRSIERNEADDSDWYYDGYWFWCDCGEPHPTAKGANECARFDSLEKSAK